MHLSLYYHTVKTVVHQTRSESPLPNWTSSDWDSAGLFVLTRLLTNYPFLKTNKGALLSTFTEHFQRHIATVIHKQSSPPSSSPTGLINANFLYFRSLLRQYRNSLTGEALSHYEKLITGQSFPERTEALRHLTDYLSQFPAKPE